jgi:hypothetical protein
MQKEIANFTPEHKDLLHRYLSFFKLKMAEGSQQAKLAVCDVRDENKKHGVFSRQQVDEIFDKLEEEVHETIQGEMENFYRMSGVFI